MVCSTYIATNKRITKPDGTLDIQSLQEAINCIMEYYQPKQHGCINRVPSKTDIKEFYLIFYSTGNYNSPTAFVELYTLINNTTYSVTFIRK